MQADRPRPDVAAALAIVRAHAPTMPQERVAAATAGGRIVAVAPRAVSPVPRFRASAMDGYALASRSVGSASPDAPVTLQIARGDGAAGLVPPPLRDGEAARISTGAPVQEGADAVLAGEHSRRASGREGCLLFQDPIAVGRNVRTRAVVPAARNGRSLIAAFLHCGATQSRQPS